MKVSATGRQAFFTSVRKSLGPLQQGQVDGINAILDEADRRQSDDRWTAYMLATAWHETATHMQPVIETRQPNEASNPSVDEAIRRLENAWAAGKMPWVKSAYWRKDASGLSWLGRGLPQTTHRENYAKLEKATGIPLTKNPNLALEPAHGVTIMFAGMIGGLYTGKKLADYFNLKTPDLHAAWRSARQIVNGLEKAVVVAAYAAKFYAAFQIAGQAAIASRPTPSSATPIVDKALNPPAPPHSGPSPAPAGAEASATKETTMNPASILGSIIAPNMSVLSTVIQIGTHVPDIIKGINDVVPPAQKAYAAFEELFRDIQGKGEKPGGVIEDVQEIVTRVGEIWKASGLKPHEAADVAAASPKLPSVDAIGALKKILHV